MANDVEIQVTADTSNAEGGFQKVKSGFQGMKDSIVKNKKAIGLGITAMGVGIQALATAQAPLTESTRKLALQTGFAEDEIRGMATSLSNATFPLDSALQLMTLGAQQGVEGAEALKEYAAFWDTVGDATGGNAAQLAKAGAALQAVGVDVDDQSSAVAAFGLITQHTTGTVTDFMTRMRLSAAQLGEANISVDEFAIALTAMENELGLTADTAGTEFRKAVAEATKAADGQAISFRDVTEALGLTAAQVAKYSGLLPESQGVIQANADAHASTKTVFDKLKSSVADLVFQNGALLEKVSMMAPILMAAAPAITGVSAAMGLLNGITLTTKISFLGLNIALGPLTLIIIGIGVAIAAGIAIWKNWDKIVNFLKMSIGFLKDTFVQSFEKIKSVFKTVTDFVFNLYDSKLGWLLPAGPLIKAIFFLKDNWQKIWEAIKSTFQSVTDSLISTFQTVKTTILGIWDGIVSGIKGAVNTIIGAINTVIRGFNNFKLEIPAVKVGPVTITPGFSVGMPQIPEIPKLAKGGIVNRPTLAMLGESGPEAVVPLGSGAGMTVNLVINGDVNGMDDFEQKVTSVIRDAVLGGGFSGVLARA